MGVCRLDGLLERWPRTVACTLFVLLLAIYHVDDSLVEEGDAVANVELPLSLLESGALEFSPRYSPIIFFWKSQPPLTPRDDYYVRNWYERHEGRPAGVWYATGALRLNGPRYFATKSPVREGYVSTFSIVPGMTFLPLAAVLRAIDPDFANKTGLRLSAAKLYAASLIALSAVLLFGIARRYTRPSLALLVTAAYALGTCMWSIAAETLWQQTVNIALLVGAGYAFLRTLEAPQSKLAPIACGVLLGTATASRPTAVFYVVSIGLYLWSERRNALPLVAAGATPVLAAIAIYNIHYFGSPFNFAQEVIGHQIAMQKTGNANTWQTPLVVGAFGLLFSPSRGLLIFSPFLVLAAFGAARIFKRPEYTALRPLVLSALLTMLVQAKWFDWWGGWAYGYRPWLEAVPMLALCLLPMIEQVVDRPWTTALFALALGWSIFVQGLGAFAYDKYWNARDLYSVASASGDQEFFETEPEARRFAERTHGEYRGLFSCNIDLPPCRYRLWSWGESIISFYLERWPVSREHRIRSSWHDLAPFQR
jgi:hypothetical protein